MFAPLLSMLCPCRYSHICRIHFYLVARARSSLDCEYALYLTRCTVRFSLSCVHVFVISSFLHILITVFKSESVRSLIYAFVRSLHMLDIIRTRIMLSFRWWKPHFPTCEVMFVKKERNVSPSFWLLLLKM